MVDAGSRHGRGDGAQTTLRRALAVAWSLGAIACGEPSADVVAVWVDAAADDEGNRRVRLYEAGERDVASIVPDIPGSGIDLLQIGVDARARGVAVSATDETVWFQRGSGRRVTMSAALVGRVELVAPGFSFTRSGDAMLRALEVDPVLPPTWLLAPLAAPDALDAYLLSPPRPTSPTRRWVLDHASDAPVVVMFEVGGTSNAVEGDVLVAAYPSELGEGPVVDDLRPLGRGTMIGRGPNVDDLHFLDGCPQGLCVAPSGRVLWTHASGGGCGLERWSWEDAASTEASTPPLPVALPCPNGAPTQLVAVLDDDLVVLDDALRLYLVDLADVVDAALDDTEDPALEAGGELPVAEPRVSSLPKPTGIALSHVVARGRVLVVSSQAGEVMRIDADGPRIVSGVQTPCTIRDGFVVSPGGAWVVLTCNGENGAPDGLDGQIQRVSVLGSELYVGTPMRPIAVDDDGNALFYSIASDDEDGVPRGLFVLTGDGQLSRIDELEPFPGLVRLSTPDGDGTPGRFAAAGPS